MPRTLPMALLLLGSACAAASPQVAGTSSTSSTGDPASTGTTSAVAATSGSSSGGDRLDSGSGTSGSEGGSTDTTAADSTTGAPIDPCALPDPAPAWLTGDLQDTVARLSGASELQPGITLPNRATPEHRAQTAAWLLQRISDLGLEPATHDYGPGTNVLTRLPATIPSEGTLVVGAHYDSVMVSPGAADNASGSAAVLAAARQLQDVGCRRYDVVFVWFDQEEAGLQGSAAYAAALVEDREPVIAVHSIDMIAYDGDGDGVIEIDQPAEGLSELYAEAGAMLDPPVTTEATSSVFTDYRSFQDAGFAAVGLMEEYVSGDTTPHWHQPTDVYDNVDFAYLSSGVALLHQALALQLLPPA